MKPLDGQHLIVDGIMPHLPSCPVAEGLLRKAVELADMTVIVGPIAEQSATSLVAFAILAESHTSLHVNAGEGIYHFYFDLFSCKRFQVNRIEILVCQTLRPLHTRKLVLYRSDAFSEVPVLSD